MNRDIVGFNSTESILTLSPSFAPIETKNCAKFFNPESEIRLNGRPFFIVHSVASLVHFFLFLRVHQRQEDCAFGYWP